MWTQAPGRRRTSSIIGPIGSKAPVFTFPAWRQTISGRPAGMASRVASRASSRIRPCPSAAAIWTRSRPRPRYCSAPPTVECASPPRTTSISGAPTRPFRLDVPAGVLEDGVARRRQAREVRHLTARDQAVAGAGRQAEQVDEPRADGLLDDGRGRTGRIQPRVLVPRRGEPVGRDRGRDAAADDVAEVARPGHRDDAGVRVPGQPLDDLDRVLAHLRQGRHQGGPQRRDVLVDADVPLGHAPQVLGGELGGPGQERPRILARRPRFVGHRMAPVRRSPRSTADAHDAPRCARAGRPACISGLRGTLPQPTAPGTVTSGRAERPAVALAQWQSIGLWLRRLWVRAPYATPTTRPGDSRDRMRPRARPAVTSGVSLPRRTPRDGPTPRGPRRTGRRGRGRSSRTRRRPRR